MTQQQQVYFLDAAALCEPSPMDGVHLDMDTSGHKQLGKAIADVMWSLPFLRLQSRSHNTPKYCRLATIQHNGSSPGSPATYI
jgi:hypothetical protein